MTGRVLNGNLIVTIDKRFNGSAKESGTRMAALISRIDGSECLFRKGLHIFIHFHKRTSSSLECLSNTKTVRWRVLRSSVSCELLTTLNDRWSVLHSLLLNVHLRQDFPLEDFKCCLINLLTSLFGILSAVKGLQRCGAVQLVNLWDLLLIVKLYQRRRSLHLSDAFRTIASMWARSFLGNT